MAGIQGLALALVSLDDRVDCSYTLPTEERSHHATKR